VCSFRNNAKSGISPTGFRLPQKKPTGILTGKTLFAAVPKMPNFFPRFSIYLYIFIGEKNYSFFDHFSNRQKSRQKHHTTVGFYLRPSAAKRFLFASRQPEVPCLFTSP
jgi:GR25 family glycosyltransferase involved in LPS biosynthesis